MHGYRFIWASFILERLITITRILKLYCFCYVIYVVTEIEQQIFIIYCVICIFKNFTCIRSYPARDLILLPLTFLTHLTRSLICYYNTCLKNISFLLIWTYACYNKVIKTQLTVRIVLTCWPLELHFKNIFINFCSHRRKTVVNKLTK